MVPAFYISLCALPFALLDTLIFTNKVIGPLFSFRRQLSQLAELETAEELHFRKGDFFADLATNFNRIRMIVAQNRHTEALQDTTSDSYDPINVG